MAYVPIITPAMLTNVIYTEILNEITRNDGGAIATEACNTAIDEAKMYLGRYDPIQLFGDADNDVSATFTSNALNNMIKDMAVWQLLRLANPNINYEDAQLRYKEAIRKLERIQDGKSNPIWPYLNTDTAQALPSLEIFSTSQKKRNNTGFDDFINTDHRNK